MTTRTLPHPGGPYNKRHAGNDLTPVRMDSASDGGKAKGRSISSIRSLTEAWPIMSLNRVVVVSGISSPRLFSDSILSAMTVLRSDCILSVSEYVVVVSPLFSPSFVVLCNALGGGVTKLMVSGKATAPTVAPRCIMPRIVSFPAESRAQDACCDCMEGTCSCSHAAMENSTSALAKCSSRSLLGGGGINIESIPESRASLLIIQAHCCSALPPMNHEQRDVDEDASDDDVVVFK